MPISGSDVDVLLTYQSVPTYSLSQRSQSSVFERCLNWTYYVLLSVIHTVLFAVLIAPIKHG